MKGKSVILAGGSGGLGATVARAVAERGGVPVIGCRQNRERADVLARSLNAPVVVGDILDEPVRQKLIDTAKDAGDHIEESGHHEESES